MIKNEAVLKFLATSRRLSLEAESLLSRCLKDDVWCFDEENIHNLRILFRQLISLHEFYDPLLQPKRNREMCKSYKRLLRTLGPQRKEDVFTKLIHQFEDSMEEKGASEKVQRKREEIHSLLHHEVKKKDRLQEEIYLYRMLFYRTVSAYFFEPQQLFSRKSIQLGYSLKDFVSKRFKKLLKEYRSLERLAKTGGDKEIHTLRIHGKTIYYGLKLHREFLRTPEEDQIARLKQRHDVTGKLHDLEELLEILKKMKNHPSVLHEAEEMVAFFEEEKKNYFSEFLSLYEK